MKNIKENIIVSNIFLNQKNINWKIFKNNNQKIKFLEQSQFNGVLKILKKTTTVNIICFFQEMTLDQENKKILNLSVFFKNLENICRSTQEEVILTASFWKKFSNINFSRNNSNEVIDKDKIIKTIRKLQIIHKNLYFIDIDNFFAEKGFDNCFSNRDYYLYSSKVSNLGLNILINKINEIYIKNKMAPIKVLVFDCDNTLWGGVIGEDGFGKILIGQDGIGKIYSNFQKTILNLSKKGYLIAIASKNNLNDVVKVFESHKMMILKKKNIISFKVNWSQKYKNLIELSKELNLGLNSFLFWDDNPIERQQMKKFLPEVYTVDVDDDIAEWPEQIRNDFKISKFSNTPEDKKKKKQYEIVGKFIESKKKLNSLDEEINFLESTKLSPKIFKLEDSFISRASQMTQKTTQFNFRTKKYSEAEIVNMKKNKDYLIYLINLKDVYGDHGIISMIILKKINNKIIFLDTMLMSCRVLGRYLDHWIFNECRKIAKKNNFDIILSEFIKTDRNQNFQNSLKLNGFHECKSNDLKIKMNKSQKGFLYKTSTKINKSKFDKIFK